MSSHGIPRLESSGPKSEKARHKEIKEIEEYKALSERVTNAVREKQFSTETLDLTSKLLTKNPEYYTIWNHRRRILLNLFTQIRDEPNESSEGPVQKIENLISSDLDFIIPLLKNFPKCYWIWNHRVWLLHQTTHNLSPQTSQKYWIHEISLVEKMLTLDRRNFHGWSYRRMIIKELRKFQTEDKPSLISQPEQQPQPQSQRVQEIINVTENSKASKTLTEQEFEYTTKMVHTDLSNFSAWHNRSKLLPKLLTERSASQTERRDMFNSELHLIDDALSMDPNDQSLWFYHQFLMSEAVTSSTSSPLSQNDDDDKVISTQASGCFGIFGVEDKKDLLRGEILFYKEILEDCEDCKLLYQFLLELAGAYLNIDPGEREVVNEDEMQGWLESLTQLDPMRRGRWSDLAVKLGLHVATGNNSD